MGQLLNSALPPLRHRPDTGRNTKILSVTWLRRKARKKERNEGRMDGRKEGWMEEKVIKNILKVIKNKKILK